MDFDSGPKDSRSRSKNGHSINDYWGLQNFASNLAATLVSFPFEASKVRAIFGHANILPHGYPLQWFRFGFSQHLLRMVWIERMIYMGHEDFRSYFLQGLQFPGFWRRLLTDVMPFFMGFTLTGYFEAKKIDQLARQSSDLQSWNKAAVASKRFWKFSTVSALMSCVFIAVERGASEQLRKRTYKSDSQQNYMSYDKSSLLQKALTIPFASAVSYPLEFIRVTCFRRVTQILADESVSLLAEARLILQAHSNAGLRGYMLPLLPYTVSNLIYYSTFMKLNSFARAVY